jgi:ATP-dependent DNA ligase
MGLVKRVLSGLGSRPYILNQMSEEFSILRSTARRYPARPYSCINALSLASFGKWAFEPKLNGWRCVIDMENKVVVSRHGTTFAETGRIMDIARAVPELAGFRLIDCEFLGKRTKAGKGSVVIMDMMDSPLPYSERMSLISGFAECPLDDIPTNALMRFPSYTQAKAQQVLEDMKEINARRGEVIWEGFVAKHPNSTYPLQLSPSAECRFWAKAKLINGS